jgi:hypothetical protein
MSRSILFGVLLAPSLLAFPSLAAAQTTSSAPASGKVAEGARTDAANEMPLALAPYKYAGSPQNFAFELRFSPYRPAVDSAPGLTGAPFSRTFGDNPRLMVSAEFDWQALRIRHFGSLGPGLTAGYTSFARPAYFTGTNTTSAQKTNFEVAPFLLQAVLRVDVLATDFGIPIVPYAKAGIGAGYWRAYGADGTTTVNNKSAKGVSFGPSYAVGGALLLDFLDRTTAASADEASGINNTYIFGEFWGAELSNFGSAKAMHVGDRTFALGLAFEF